MKINPKRRKIAYFSMEIGLNEKMHTYSGGLGILAGDTLKSAADLEIPMVAVTLLNRYGYFKQELTHDGQQIEHPDPWPVEEFLTKEDVKVSVRIEGRSVRVTAWRYDVVGVTGYVVPVYFLDTYLEENSEYDRKLTDYLYGGDQKYRLCQEVVLGIGGVRILRALGYDEIETFHMNEGHSALLTFELIDEELRKTSSSMILESHLKAVREKCVFTTHTPVPAGHDKFPLELVRKVIGPRDELFSLPQVVYDNTLNMTYLALNMSRYINGVAKKHGEVSKLMFAGYDISSITNGVHAQTWVSEPFQELFDKYIPMWRTDNFSLRYALSIPNEEIWNAHMKCKKTLLEYVKTQTGVEMNEEVLTIGFARRATAYKRADLLLYNLERLKEISSKDGKIQVIYAGKAHPKDEGGKQLIKKIFTAIQELKSHVPMVYLPNYDMKVAKMMVSGVDIWLNTPQPPLEASGTSGMKASLNGVPNFSVLDGWWIEGCIEGITGWAIGDFSENASSEQHAKSLYEKLEKTIIPLYYQHRDQFIQMMKYAIAINGSFFNTHRMVQEYVINAYFHKES
ncbi:alpha-glucan family phosphorylase [Pseudothermotoga thermarum]|uniref:glycogen phosphorylase n=1 Tax=Pseudothermotoga thermarum DSM 5069 TaxID=688269 RepID=F7YW48_9THEM|nr:alpha-glucan family phosphorylase [Pseudothermotoga thermarum]AEH50537.1 alpha-glucan phosphorylase [Pseudothermotoga thermarum DSM 5069]